MPPPPKSTEDVQVAASNQTLNAFLGGRRPSWYQNTKSTTGLKPRKSTVRPVSQSKAAEKRVRKTPVTENGDGVKDVAPDDQRASQKHDQQLVTAAPRDGSLLPSPALTNELSPALSTRHASPSEQTGSESFRTEDRNTEAELRALRQSPAASQPSPATTETPQSVDVGMVHIEHGPKPRPTQATSEPVSSQAGSPTAQRVAPPPVSTASPKPQTPTTPVSGPTGSVAPRTTNVRPSLTRKRTRPSSTSADNRAPQRPRTGMPHEQSAITDLAGQWQQYCQQLDNRIAACGGWANLGSGIESPRFKYLRDALLAGDGFYVLLHQLLCLWSLDADRAYGTFPTLERATIDHGFGFLMNILRPNSLLAYNSLVWFAEFPKPVSGDGMLAIPSLAPRIGTFLTAFVLRWDRMLAQAKTRKYPLTAFELGPTLNCDSRILQGTFFTVSRRVVGIGDSVAGQLNAVFCKDQEDEAHLREIGAPADLIQKYRQERIRHYSDLAREAKQAETSRSPSTSSSVQPQRAQTFPTASAPPTPNSGSPAQSGQMLPSQLIAPNVAMPIPALPRSNSIPTGVPLHILQAQQQAVGQHPNAITQMNHLQPNSHPASPQTNPSPISVSMAPLPSPTHPQATQVMSYPSPHYHQQHFQPAMQHAPQFAPPRQYPQQYHPQQAQQILPSQRIPHHPPVHPQHVLPNQQIPYALQIPQSQHGRPVQEAHEPRHPAPSIAQLGQSQPGMVHMPNNIPPHAANSRTVSANGVADAGGVQYQNLQIAAQRVRRIPEHEYPSSPYDWLSHASAAHLSILRSPERRAARQLPSLVRHYQHVSDFAFGPMRFPPQTGPRSLGFTVSHDSMARIPLAFESEVGLPVRYYGDGSLRYRLRLCMRPESDDTVSPSDWVVSPTHWPQAIFPALNGQSLMVRRKQHFHHDLPVDLSDLVVKGDNVVRISFPDKPVNYKKGMTYFVAIEIVSTMSHDALTSMVLEAPPISAEETGAEIKRRLKPSESDDVVVEDNTFCINVADPFSSSLFEVPVRGVECKHLDCFDLETWLQTRQGKPGGGLEEPSMADNWKCPICFLDARPSSLRVDEFFAEVRKGLLAQGLGKTKKILVTADGSWTAVPELDDSEDESPIQPNRSVGERINQKKATAPANIIEIDDD